MDRLNILKLVFVVISVLICTYGLGMAGSGAQNPMQWNRTPDATTTPVQLRGFAVFFGGLFILPVLTLVAKIFGVL